MVVPGRKLYPGVALALALAYGGCRSVERSRFEVAGDRAREVDASGKPPRVGESERGRRPPQRRISSAELALRASEAQAESAKILAARRAGVAARAVAGQSWVSLGPTDALAQFNGGAYEAVDSGRPNDVVIDPRNPNIAYVALSGGGVWKTYDATSAGGPSWAPLTDSQPNLAIGALAIDAANPDVLYMGTGDTFDGAGNTVQVTGDGGINWSAPVVLAGAYPAPNGQQAPVAAVRSLRVRGGLVLAGTDGGLFASTDSGASFRLVDLPNRNGKVLIESIWSVVDVAGVGWVVSGVPACSETDGRAPLTGGTGPSAECPEGNAGNIWYSTDGATWSLAAVPGAMGGRISLAAAGTVDSSRTALYAFVGAVDNQSTMGFWRSLDRGRTWVDATGTLRNPSSDCADLDMGHDQTWYNQAIIGDPSNPDRVIVGGNLCGARTLNGTSASPVWELVSHWLPISSGAVTSFGRLRYVHADWHAGTAVVVGGVTRVYVGSDGGVFSSADVFSPSIRGENVSWARHNRGLVTHLLYSVASGDPATQNPFVLFSGAQDNGTRYRVDPGQPSVFNQVIGGDGIGATVHASTGGSTFWGSVQYGRLYCQGTLSECATGDPWNSLEPVLGMTQEEEVERFERAAGHDPNDAEPFFIHYANVETDTTGPSVLTHSVGRVFVASTNAAGDLEWKPISQDLTGSNTGFGNVAASRTTPGLYGAVGLVSRAPFFVSTAGNTLTNWTVTQPVTPLGTADRLTGPSSMDFPPVLPQGSTPGQVFVGAFTGILTNGEVPPNDKGRLYRTTNGGQTWTSIVGTGANRLPNVPVYVIKYDPVDPKTLYAGTELGVYVTTDDGSNWSRMGIGLPVVQVRDLYVAKNQEFIRAATWGRGLWEIYPSANAHRGTPGNGDYDRNQVIDWIDVAATASRMGTTPVTALPPLYTWIMDVADASTTPTQRIDLTDLNAILGKLGGRP